MNRIDKKFQYLKSQKKPAFIPFLTAGDPDLETTKSLILEFEKKGADIIELGIPFSDPIADGPVIQSSYYRALTHRVKVAQILDMICTVRKETDIPIVAMVSYSIVFKSEANLFIEKALQVGIDGLTIPDLPVEECNGIFEHAQKKIFKIVCFVAPTTTDHRMSLIAKRSQGFLYYISVVGITGMRDSLPEDIVQNIAKIKQMTNVPVAVGFGVSTPEQAKLVGSVADGVIVGSAIVKEIQNNINEPRNILIEKVGEFVRHLAIGVKGK